MPETVQLAAVGKAAAVVLATLLALTPICSAVCHSRICDLPASATDGPCHQMRAASPDAVRLLATSPSCSGREMAVAVPESRTQSAKQLCASHSAAFAPAKGAQPPAADPANLERRPGPPIDDSERSSPVLRI